jgi:Peptidase family S41
VWTSRISDRVLYVQLNAIVVAPGRSLAQFARDLRTDLQKNPAAHLILDLRNNNGGEAGLADEMLRTLIAYDAGGGRIWVPIGRVTFSAAETLAARIDQWTAATFVGEPTGSRPNHFGNEAQFVLPHSGVRGTISSGWNQPVSGRDDRIWIAPAVRVRSESADYFAARDPVLDRILSEIGAGGAASPSS